MSAERGDWEATGNHSPASWSSAPWGPHPGLIRHPYVPGASCGSADVIQTNNHTQPFSEMMEFGVSLVPHQDFRILLPFVEVPFEGLCGELCHSRGNNPGGHGGDWGDWVNGEIRTRGEANKHTAPFVAATRAPKSSRPLVRDVQVGHRLALACGSSCPQSKPMKHPNPLGSNARHKVPLTPSHGWSGNHPDGGGALAAFVLLPASAHQAAPLHREVVGAPVVLGARAGGGATLRIGGEKTCTHLCGFRIQKLSHLPTPLFKLLQTTRS